MNESTIRLPEAPEGHYNFYHVISTVAPVPRNIVLWNVLDFSHVNWVHRRNYKYCKVLAESNRTHLLEYGVRMFFFLRLPFSVPTLMWHEYVPPRLVRHLSRSAWGSYTRVEMEFDEFEQDGRTHTRLTHRYATHLPVFLLPFKKLMTWYLDAWSERLWAEDCAMLERRHRVLQAGFKDHPVDVTPRAAEGFAAI
jgi:hypothetical protein